MHCQHHCQCEHKILAFCSHCNVVYCKDCKKEWVEKVNWYYYYGPTWQCNETITDYNTCTTHT